MKNKNLSKESLYDFYVVQGFSIPEVAMKLGCGKTTVLNYMKKYSIPRRNLSESLGGKPKSVTHRLRLSESKKGSKNPNFGKKCRSNGHRSWYQCLDGNWVSMRSNWEVAYAEYLTAKGISWQYEPVTFNLSDGRAYTPDFYLSESDEYIEVKGWLRNEHKERIAEWKKSYPSIKHTIADKEYLLNLGIDLKQKFVSTRPKFPCELCSEQFHRMYKKQRFCSIACRNKHIANNPLTVTKEYNSDKRSYRGNQSGEASNCSKLTEKQVRMAHELRLAGKTLKEIATKLSASIGNIGNILAGRSWKKVYQEMRSSYVVS